MFISAPPLFEQPIHITINRYNFQSLSVYPRVSSSLLTVASSKLRACGIGGYEDTVLNPSCLMHSSLPRPAQTNGRGPDNRQGVYGLVGEIGLTLYFLEEPRRFRVAAFGSSPELVNLTGLSIENEKHPGQA